MKKFKFYFTVRHPKEVNQLDSILWNLSIHGSTQAIAERRLRSRYVPGVEVKILTVEVTTLKKAGQ